jgi:hypothetical protein
MRGRLINICRNVANLIPPANSRTAIYGATACLRRGRFSQAEANNFVRLRKTGFNEYVDTLNQKHDLTSASRLMDFPENLV